MKSKIRLSTNIVLFFVIILFSFFVVTPEVEAQQAGPVVDLADTSAAVRYRTGVKFNLKARVTNSLFEKAELKVRFGTRGIERTYPVDFPKAASISTDFTVLARDENIATGMPLLYTWNITLNNGAKVNTRENSIIYQDFRRWNQLEGKKVTVRWYAGDQAYGNTMFTLANDVLTSLEQRYNMVTTEQIYLSIFDNEQDFFEAVEGKIPPWAGGVAYPEINEILLVAPQYDISNQYIGFGIPHELAHMAIYDFVGKPVPHWLDEGFAVFHQNRQNPEYLKVVKEAAQGNYLLNFDFISRGFPADSASAKLAYAQSRSMVDFLINRFGDPVFANLLDQLRTKELPEAFKATYGIEFGVMDNLWRNYILGRPINLPKALLSGPVNPYPPRNANTTIAGLNLKPEFILIGAGVVLAFVSLLTLYVVWRARSSNSKRAKLYPETQTYPGLEFNPPPFITPPPNRRNK
jgi:hypothetical protein